MSDQGPGIVPIVVEAFVVNDHVRLGGGNAFYRAEMQYNVLKYPANGRFKSTDEFTQPGQSGYFNGVYLKWRLPDAFLQGEQDSVSGTTTFRPVPNRWLVVRYSGALSSRHATAWIVASDDLTSINDPQNASQVGSMYVTPGPGQAKFPVGVRIGRSVPLATGTWTETGATLELTAVTPGNPAFAYYQPACNNVFSLMDPLDGHTPNPDALSYQVFGWFSSRADDPLKANDKCDFNCCLKALGWEVANGSDPAWTASWSLMCGMVTGVPWQTASIPPGGAPRQLTEADTPPISIAIGHTAVEALTALIAGQGGPEIDTDLLNAFQLDMIDALDAADPGAVLADTVHSTFFRKYTGGYVWEIVDAPGTQPGPLAGRPSDMAERLPEEQTWLATLNRNQALLDQATRDLTALRRQLYVLWWKYMEFNIQYQDQTEIPGLTLEALRQQLDPDEQGSLAQKVSQQRETVGSFPPEVVPGGDTPQALEAAILAFAKAHGLSPDRELKRASAPPFYEPHNPVILIAGTGASGIVGKQPMVPCRFASQIVTGFRCGQTTVTASTPHLAIPIPSLASISGVQWLTTGLAEKLVHEFFFLDPANAAAIATAAGLMVGDVEAAMKQSASYAGMGILPGGAATWQTNPWVWTKNPWHPLLLTYRADYYPIGYGTIALPNWTFDGGDYTWNGQKASVGPVMSMEGIIQLTPAAAFNMKSRIEAYLDNHPHLDSTVRKELVELLAFVETHDAWDLLSQSLDGFDQQMLLNMTGVFLGTAATAQYTDPPESSWHLPDLIGPSQGNPPRVGEIPQSPPYGPSPFLPWRSGQFLLTDVKVVDEWGQALWPITPNNNTQDTIYRPPEMTAAPPVKPGIDAFVQLSPALLQPGRLGFDLISAPSDDLQTAALTADPNPVCGWVLVNHLDRALMAYDPKGQALGGMSIAIAANDSPDVCWTDAPGSPYHGLDDIKARLRHFGPFLWTLHQQGPATFGAFLAAVDDTAWTTLPMAAALDRSLAGLIGRPLALVRSRLQFELNGQPYQDPSWQFTFAPSQPTITGYEFAIELGRAAVLEDGLIGYFSEDDYTTFNVVSTAHVQAGTYLKPIGANNNYIYLPFDAKTVRHVSMLMDPAAAVHATTGILPTLAVSLAPELTASALAAMSVTFRVDGILTDAGPARPPSDLPTVLLPVPHEKRGIWEWVERDAAGWTTYQTSANDTVARLSAELPVLRRGLLQLSAAVGDRASVRHRPNRRIEKV